MEKMNELLGYLSEISPYRLSKNNSVLRSQLEKFSLYLLYAGIGGYLLMFILIIIYRVIFPSSILMNIILILELISLFSSILAPLFQIIPGIVAIKNDIKKQFIEQVNHNEEIIHYLLRYEQETLKDSKEHVQIQINRNTSKNRLIFGQYVTAFFLLGMLCSINSSGFEFVTLFSKVVTADYNFLDFITLGIFALVLGICLGAFGLSVINRRLSYYIDLINMTLKRKQRMIYSKKSS